MYFVAGSLKIRNPKLVLTPEEARESYFVFLLGIISETGKEVIVCFPKRLLQVVRMNN